MSMMNTISAVATLTILLSAVQPASVDAANRQIASRISHAKELLGASYKRSAVRNTESNEDIAEFVESTTRHSLPKAFKSSAREISSVIMTESEKYGFDPIFVMAVIMNESSFRPRMKGGVGEIGLMQIKPDTAAWIAKAYKLDYKNGNSLYDPATNIRIGLAFMNKLRGQFASNSALYLSAYNAGAKKVRMMVSSKNAPKIYATRVMKRYFAMYAALVIGV